MNRCATQGCERDARWYSAYEGQEKGHNAPRRCVICCDAITEAMDLIHAVPMSQIHFWRDEYIKTQRKLSEVERISKIVRR